MDELRDLLVEVINSSPALRNRFQAISKKIPSLTLGDVVSSLGKGPGNINSPVARYESPGSPPRRERGRSLESIERTLPPRRSEHVRPRSRSRSRSPVGDKIVVGKVGKAASSPVEMDVSQAVSVSGSSSDSDASSSGGDFITVQGKRKRRTGKNSPTPKAPKAIKSASSAGKEAPKPSATATEASLASPGSQAPSRPDSPMADLSQGTQPRPGPTRKVAAPPPLFIHDKALWTEVSKACGERRIAYVNARAVQQGIKVTVASAGDYRELNRLLRSRNIPFHTYALKEERQVRVVVRGVPSEIGSQDIKSDLLAQGLPVVEVHRMHTRGSAERPSKPYDMVLIVCDPITENIHHPIFKISKICGLSGLSIEKPHAKGNVGQCHRCQLYGHSQRNCFGKPRCVKCLGDHGTAACPRPKDRASCAEPPSCVLCGQAGHPANYRGCPKAPKSSAPKLAKRDSDRQTRERPTLSAELPQSLRPQRPNPWTAQNHTKNFPKLTPVQQSETPAKAPQAKAPQVPAPQAPAPQAKALQAPAPQAQAVGVVGVGLGLGSGVGAVNQVGDEIDPFIVISSTFCAFFTPRAKQMAADLVACRGNIELIGRVYRAYPDIKAHIENLPYLNTHNG